MPLSASYQFIFVHIPKCAGKSISKALEKAGIDLAFKGRTTAYHQENYNIKEMWLHHLPARELKRVLPPDQFQSWFKFAVVRNPWDLLISYYHYHKKEYEQSPDFSIDWPNIAGRFASTTSFDEWIKTGIYVQPQLNFIADENKNLLVDYVARFETLADDFSFIASKLGISPSLPHINFTEHAPYRSYYTKETRDLVSEKFSEDIAHFNYTF